MDITDHYGVIYLKDGVRKDFTAIVKVNNPNELVGWPGKAGIMVRNDITKSPSSPGYIILAVECWNGWSIQWDSDGDGRLDNHTKFEGYSEWPNWLKLEKKGAIFTGYYSINGLDWNKIAVVKPSKANLTQDIGMFACRGRVEFENFAMS